MKVRYEELLPEELEEIIRAAPVAYVPLGSLEWHGYHLPLGNDAIKVHEICLCAAKLTGGVVLPPLFCGVGGGHQGYFGSLMVEEEWIKPLLKRQFDLLAEHGVRVIVAVTGHYPGEQVEMVRRAAAAHRAERGAAHVIALPEYEAFPSDPRRGDHAAKWETSILWYLRPDLVDVSRLSDGRPDPLCGIFGEDPREQASVELGAETVQGILDGLAQMVREALANA